MKNRILLVFLAIVMAVSLVVLPACKAEEAPPEAVITIYEINDLSGPISATEIPWHQSLEDYIRYLNEDQGGINGIRIELKYVDTGYELERSMLAYKRFKEEGAFITMSFASGDIDARKEMNIKDQIVDFCCPCPDVVLYPPGYHFSQGPGYVNLFGAALDWIKATWKETRPPRVASLTWDNPLGRSHLTRGPVYAKELGIDYVGTEFMGYGAIDVTPQLLKLNEAGADYVYMNISCANIAVALKSLHKLGLQDEMKIMGFTFGYSYLVVGMAGVDNAEGYLWAATTALASETDIPGVKLATEVHARYRATPMTDDLVHHWGSYELLFEAIRRALDAVGYEKLDGPALKEYGFETMTDFPGSGCRGPASYSKVDREGCKYIRMVEVRGGKAIPISDWIRVPNLVPDEYKHLFAK